MLGMLLPDIQRAPGAETRAWVDRLAATECPAITARRSRRARSEGGRDPIVWVEARGANVVDVEGNRYVDLSSGFGAAAIGHRHPKVVEAIHNQADRLVHAMGDLFPSREKILLGEKLAALTPGDLGVSILGLGGADAVEAAIKTAVIATGRKRVLAFSGGYHGLSLGALGVSGYRSGFREPFGPLASATELRLPYADCRACLLGLEPETCGLACAGYVERLLDSAVSGAEDVAALIVEPIQGRGGVIVPPDGWLRRIREWTQARGVVLILDEIYTGWGRTGAWFACEHDAIVPDVMCVGKAMGGGVPIGAAIGTPAIMEAWGEARGEAIHTSTFLGNPLACAAACAALEVMETEVMVDRAAGNGAMLRRMLQEAIGGHRRVLEIRGRGSMLGVALADELGKPWAGGGVTAMHALLDRGFIASPSGPDGDVLALSPPYVATTDQLELAVDAIAAWLDTL
jgi:4-aminobutyrate aminotransferase-like enzyme